MHDITNKPLEWQFVTRLAQCIRLHNALHSSTVPLSDLAKASFDNDIKKYSDERKRLEVGIIETYGIDITAFQKVRRELYEEMNLDDAGFEVGKGSPMWQHIDVYVDKFTAAIMAIKGTT